MKQALKVHARRGAPSASKPRLTLALREVGDAVRQGAHEMLERVIAAEIELFLRRDAEAGNQRNGYASETLVLNSVGALDLRTPRDRAERFESHVVLKSRCHDEALEKDLALLHLAGLSTRV